MFLIHSNFSEMYICSYKTNSSEITMFLMVHINTA
jgi:hypothetical protein